MASVSGLCILSQRNDPNFFSNTTSASSCPGASNTTASPAVALNGLSFGGSTGALDMIMVVNEKDTYSFSQDLNRTDLESGGNISLGVSGTVSLSFSYPKSVNGSEYKVQGLSTPISITIPHTVPLDANNSERSCRWWDEQTQEYSTEGCEVNMTLSTLEYTVCDCTHLTDFSIGQVTLIDKLLGLSDIGNTRLSDLIPTIKTLSLDDITAVTWDAIMANPSVFYVVCVMLAIYFGLLPFAMYRDFIAKQKLNEEFIFNIDETFSQKEMGSIQFTLCEIMGKHSITKRLRFLNLSRSKGKSIWACFMLRRCRLACSKTRLTVDTLEKDGFLVMTISVKNLLVMDFLSKTDPVVGMFMKVNGELVPYARSELILETYACSFKRKFVVPVPKTKEQEQVEIVFAVYDDDVHRSDIEQVDPFNNEIFLLKERNSNQKIVTLKRNTQKSLFESHSWLSTFTLSLKHTTATERLTCAVVAEISLMLFAAIFCARSDSQAPELILDLIMAFWESVATIPVFLLVTSFFTRAGRVDREMNYIDLQTAEHLARTSMAHLRDFNQRLGWSDNLTRYTLVAVNEESVKDQENVETRSKSLKEESTAKSEAPSPRESTPAAPRTHDAGPQTSIPQQPLYEGRIDLNPLKM